MPLKVLIPFADPSTVFYLPYLLSAWGLATLWLVCAQGMSWRRAFLQPFSDRPRLLRSFRTDLKLAALYLFGVRFLAAGVEGSAFLFSWNAAGRILDAWPWTFATRPWIEGALATGVTLLAYDFASYAAHRLLHAVPCLWTIHAVHHAAEILTPITAHRQHPLEPLILQCARGLAAGVGLAAVHSLLPHKTPVITICGLGAGFFLYMFTVNLHHAPVPVHYPRWLRAILISPHMHHLHHSVEPRHQGANFGVIFSIWDRLFGTVHDETIRLGGLRFGLSSGEAPRSPAPAAARFLTLGG